MLAIPAFWRLRKVDCCAFEMSLGYIEWDRVPKLTASILTSLERHEKTPLEKGVPATDRGRWDEMRSTECQRKTEGACRQEETGGATGPVAPQQTTNHSAWRRTQSWEPWKGTVVRPHMGLEMVLVATRKTRKSWSSRVPGKQTQESLALVIEHSWFTV